MFAGAERSLKDTNVIPRSQRILVACLVIAAPLPARAPRLAQRSTGGGEALSRWRLSRRRLGLRSGRRLASGTCGTSAAPCSTALSGPKSRLPRIVEAFRLSPIGKAKGLKKLAFRGQVPIDPRSQDFFQAVIEERGE